MKDNYENWHNLRHTRQNLSETHFISSLLSDTSDDNHVTTVCPCRIVGGLTALRVPKPIYISPSMTLKFIEWMHHTLNTLTCVLAMSASVMCPSPCNTALTKQRVSLPVIYGTWLTSNKPGICTFITSSSVSSAWPLQSTKRCRNRCVKI